MPGTLGKNPCTASALCALIVLCGCRNDDSGSQRFPPDTVQKLDNAIASAMQTENLPSVAIGIWVPGEGAYVAAMGTANLATGRPREAEDPFRIASITKSFTGTAILQLVDEGQLSTSDKLAKWYPSFPNAGLISVRDLLRMRSGIADSADHAFLDLHYANPLLALTAEQMIGLSAARATEFVLPDTVTRYTNVNFILLERIVEKVSMTDIRSYLAEKIFRPLAMQGTLYPTGNDIPGQLRGYSLDAATGRLDDRTILNPTPPGGAGALVSTLPDLRAYGRAMCDGSLLKPATQKARLETTVLEGAPDFVRYGEGVSVLGRFCGHNGTIFGFSSELWYLPEKDAVIVVNVNRLDLDDKSKSTGIFFAVSKILFPNLVHW